MAAQNPGDRAELERRLGALIGCEEVSDFFEHALSCDSGDKNTDLWEFMSSLLGGQSGDDVRRFCSDVKRFQNGRALSAVSAAPPQPKKKAPLDYSGAAGKQKRPQQRGVNKREQKRLDLQRRNNPNAAQQQRQRQPAPVQKTTPKVTKPPPVRPPPAMKPAPVQPPPAKTAVVSAQAPVFVPQKKTPTPRPLPRGTAKIDCGCFGTKYDPLTNCLSCGRIICKREGYGFCPTCGYLVEAPSPSNGGTAAERHKERLLRFDREFAQRTRVYDDQADYFANSTSTWLTQDERGDAEEEDRIKRKALHERKKPVLALSFH